MRRVFRLALSVVVLLALGSCAGTGGMPRNPFRDITVPETFFPYSDRWLFIKSPTVTAAKLVYMTQLDMEMAATAVRAALTKGGWIPQAASRGVSRDGFRMVTMDFTKGKDSCRANVIEGAHATHVDLAVARLTTE